MQLAEIQAKSKSDSDQMKEDRKDKRVSMQGNEQRQTQKEKMSPDSFESIGNDNLSGFGLDQFMPK